MIMARIAMTTPSRSCALDSSELASLSAGGCALLLCVYFYDSMSARTKYATPLLTPLYPQATWQFADKYRP